jgi:molecular chaperone GrpE
MNNKNNQNPEVDTQDLATDEVVNEAENAAAEQPEAEAAEETLTAEEALQKELDDTKAQLEKEKKEYLFLMAEFDNFRKRTLKEKSELIKNGGEKALAGLLPIVDDFERSLDAIKTSEEAASIREGVELIYNKFIKYLEQNGVKAIDSAAGTPFDTELHEAVTMFPAPAEELKGKVIDTVQKGYMLNEKVLRHAKVVVGQ